MYSLIIHYTGHFFKQVFSKIFCAAVMIMYLATISSVFMIASLTQIVEPCAYLTPWFFCIGT